MRRTRIRRAGAAIGICALLGALAGIAGSAAAPSTKSKKASAAQRANRPPGEPGHGPFGGPAVHSESVVLNKAGTAFENVTLDNGTVKSVSGDQLTITESAKNVTYKDVTITVPSNATIRRNDAKATLADLKSGDRVHVIQAPEGVSVFAEDAAHQRSEPHGFRGPPPDGPPPDGPPASP
jgi:hypothetical protein